MENEVDILDINSAVNFDDEDTLKDRYLTFKIGKESYAFAIKYVTEIIGIQKITKVPNIKKHIKGIINLRGIILPVVEVRTRFNIPEIEYTDRTCIIHVNVEGVSVGLIVDEVSEVLNIPQDSIAPPPLTNKGSNSRFIYGVGKTDKSVKMILDIHKLLYDGDESEKIKEN